MEILRFPAIRRIRHQIGPFEKEVEVKQTSFKNASLLVERDLVTW